LRYRVGEPVLVASQRSGKLESDWIVLEALPDAYRVIKPPADENGLKLTDEGYVHGLTLSWLANYEESLTRLVPKDELERCNESLD